MSEPALKPEGFYHRHLFFCCNQRDGGRECCADKGSVALRNYCKRRVRELGMASKGKIRVNLAGCMDRCSEGPILVVYPEGVWYHYRDRHDIDEIIDSHLQHGRPVERLRLY